MEFGATTRTHLTAYHITYQWLQNPQISYKTYYANIFKILFLYPQNLSWLLAITFYLCFAMELFRLITPEIFGGRVVPTWIRRKLLLGVGTFVGDRL